ncbi:hypothetical protein ACFMBG_21185 [Leisingera sp. D0M16]|uniref:hypothetical protein n=1 Tax=Leisingera coralii TaxID=3351347 RepID=UPI003B7B5D01
MSDKTAAELPADQDSKTLAIVYQFGKVASTSLVATLNELDGVEAVQSHFLGKRALGEIFEAMMRPGLPEYFFNHQLGQFTENARLTRRLNRIRGGQSSQRLLVLSLTREPLEWFRSSTVQDIEGYLPRFRHFLNRLGIAYDSDSELVQLALTRLMAVFTRVLAAHGGTDAVLKTLASDPAAVFGGSPLQDDADSQAFFYMMLRPFTWFRQHFEHTLEIRLDDMAWEDGILSYSGCSGDYFIFRYEDIGQAFPACLERLGFRDIPTIQRKNVSSRKRLAQDADLAFQSPAADRLRELFRDSEYARRFGYTGP